MIKNIIVAAPGHKLDGYCFTSEDGESQKTLSFEESLNIGKRAISSFKMTFSPNLIKGDWLVWAPNDNAPDNQSHEVIRTFFLGGNAEDGCHGTVKAKDILEKVVSPSGQEYKLCLRYRHWAFYEAVTPKTVH